MIVGGEENMERLTKITDVGLPVIVGDKSLYPVECYDCCIDNKVAKKLLKNAIAKLAEYEDLEEQGRLLKLPCAVEDTVYKVSPYHVYVDTCQITGFAECDSIKTMCYTVYIDPDEEDVIALSDFGKTVFLTREEAEAALKEL